MIEAVLSLPKEKRESAVVCGSDRDAGVVGSAKENALRAGVSVELSCNSFSSHQWFDDSPRKGLIITNPPYGARLKSRHDVGKLYTAFGQKVRQMKGDWRVAMLCNEHLAKCTNLSLEKVLSTKNGGIPVHLFIGKKD